MYRSPPGTICRSQRHGRFVKSTSLDFVGLVFNKDVLICNVYEYVYMYISYTNSYPVCFFLHFICRDFFLFLYFLRYPFDLFCTKYVQMNLKILYNDQQAYFHSSSD